MASYSVITIGISSHNVHTVLVCASLQVKSQELDELNKELRQCNLQQFIQQTGVPPNQQTDLQAETEFIQVSQLVLDTDTDSGTLDVAVH